MDTEGFTLNSNLFNNAPSDFQNANIHLSSMNNEFNANCNINSFEDNTRKNSEYEDLTCNLEINVQSRIKYLEEELSNAQADKEFVWSLWRQLQTTNPDITSCIGSVVKREKEKAELKDSKVLEILQAKDDKINELYEAFQVKEKEIIQLNEKLVKSEIQTQAKIEEVNFMEMNSKTFADKEQMYEQMLRSRDDKFEKAVKDNELDKQHLINKLRDLVKETAECQEREAALKLENTKQNQTIETLNSEIKQSNENYEKLLSELNTFRTQLDDTFKSENEKLRNETTAKTEQNEKLRKELNELWSKINSNADYTNQLENIIKQFKQTQNDLQNTIKIQRETFEKENDNYKQMYEQINSKYEESLKQEKLAKEKDLFQQQTHQQKHLQTQQLKLNEKSHIETIKALQYEIDQLKLKIKLQGQQITDKKIVCEELNKKIAELENTKESESKLRSRSSILKGSGSSSSSENFQKFNKTKNQSLAQQSQKNLTFSSGLTRSKSFNKTIADRPAFKHDSEEDEINYLMRSKSFERIPSFNASNSNFKYTSESDSKFKSKSYMHMDDHKGDEASMQSTNKMRQFYENAIEAKDKQLETLRQAHQRRLERLINLEKQHKLLKDHLRSYVDEEAIKEDFYKHQYRSTSALNDTENFSRNYPDNIGYVRNDGELLRNELKMSRHESRRLLHENLDLKENIDILNVKNDEQNEEIQDLQLKLNFKLNEQEHSHQRAEKHYEFELKTTNERLKKSVDEIYQLKKNITELDAKCGQLAKERAKYAELSSKLSDENKKLYKKWFQIRTNESKFRSSLIDQMNKHSHAKSKRKVFRSCTSKTGSKLSEAAENSNDFLIALMSSSFSTSKSMSDLSSSNTTLNDDVVDDWDENLDSGIRSKKSNKKSANESMKSIKAKFTKKLKQQEKKNKTLSMIQTQFEKLTTQKLEIEAKLIQSKNELEKFQKDISNLEQRNKTLKCHNDTQTQEINSLRKKELDFKDREIEWRKQDEQSKDDIKKPLESKIRQLSSDLSKQIGNGKTLKNDNEKLNDKLKVNEEKLNHTERDNTQKKQLIEFYKKKLEEYSSKEKNDMNGKLIDEITADSLSSLKAQIKKLNESVDKSKVEIKSLKTRLQVVQSEKSSTETKLVDQEKQFNDLNYKLDLIRKDKLNKENHLKQSKQKTADLEAYIENLESTAECKIQTLSDATHQTLSIAQMRLKFAFKSVDSYEKMFKFLYESLIGRCIELRKEIKNEKNNCEKNASKNQKSEGDQTIDENMKMAMNLASNVLNLTSNELEDILSSSNISNTTDNDPNKTPTNKSKDPKEENDTAYKKQCKKLLSDFEQRFTCTKKEKMIKSMNDIENESANLDETNKEICGLISQRLNDVLNYERELASLNALKQN